jgi:UDP-N-acetylmuramoyl-tripeptide--D-alanyl-D-alanine ligase
MPSEAGLVSRWTLPEILAATGGELLQWGPGPFCGISTDTRQTRPGEAFIALRGPRFDGHEFVADALSRGATAVIVSKEIAVPDGVAHIRVGDGLRALGDLAAARRRALPLRVIGVTGSNGKTTTKEMIAAVLSAGGEKVAKSRGTENNLVGLPHTLLGLSGDEDFAVLEMGMNHPGEIWRLAEIARPDIGVITNVGPAHLEGLGSLANVAAAKEELALELAPAGVLIVNGSDPRLVEIAERFTGRKVLVGGKESLRALSSQPTPAGQKIEIESEGRRASVEVRIRGRHNVENALLAIATGLSLGVDVETALAGLAAFTPPAMRLEVVVTQSGARILNDAYNANPASTEAAIAVLAGEPARRRFAVLGEMLELGSEAPRYHREVGAAVARARVDGLLAVGRYGAEMTAGALEAGLPEALAERCGSAAEAANRLAARLADGDVVLVKGSRGAKMEEIVSRLREQG